MDWRWAEPRDVLRIVSDWFHHGRADFLEGRTNPWPHLAKVVDDARLNAKYGDDSARRRLVCIYDRQRHLEIRRALEAVKPLVVYDLDSPDMIVAWAHPNFRYTRLAFRRMGISTELRKALSEER